MGQRRPLWTLLAPILVASPALAALLLGGCHPAVTAGSERPLAPGAGRVAATGTAWLTKTQLRWQWQLTGDLDLTVDADVYELDAFATAAADVTRLHAAGRLVICYVNAGVSEDFRPDAGRYPDSVQGAPTGSPGERWLDVRRWDELRPILADRLRLCRDKGFDAVEADNVDGYANRSGFPLTDVDQLEFNRRLAALAHSLDLAIALKNDLDQVDELQPAFDFAVNEECFRYATCDALEPFITAGKAVFHVEYDMAVERFCPQAKAYGFASIRKRSALDAWRQEC